MKKEKKQSGIAQSLAYAGGHKVLTYLGCTLSAVAAVLGLMVELQKESTAWTLA